MCILIKHDLADEDLPRLHIRYSCQKLLATLGTGQVVMVPVRAKPLACTTEEPEKYD